MPCCVNGGVYLCSQESLLAQNTLDRSYPEPCCSNGYAVRGDFCSGRETGEAQYPCCLDGAEYTCALNAQGQGQRAEQGAAAAAAVQTPVAGTQPRLVEAARPTATTAGGQLGPREVTQEGGGGSPLGAPPLGTSSSGGGARARMTLNLTSALVDGTWIARNRRAGNDTDGEDVASACELYLELDDATGEITAAPTIYQPADQSEEANAEENRSEVRRRCGIAVATGKQAGDDAFVAFAFVPPEGGGDSNNKSIVRRGRVQLLTRATTTTDADDATTDGGGDAAATRATLAILWQPASPDDGEEEGEGGAFSEAWVKKII